MIEIQNLVGGYTNPPVLKGLDLEIKNGEFFALLGPNGSGKTTLFKLITGQLPIKSGKVLLSGREVSTYSKLEKAKKMAVLTQEAQVSFDYSVEEIVSLGRYPHQKGVLKNLSREDRRIIEEVMELTKITQFRKTQFRKISGGEKQRVLLAKALAQEPELLLLDEPTNHLDIKHTFQLLDLLKERQQTKGLTIFSILHDLNVASLYADRFALLHDGNFLEIGEVELLRKEEQLQKVYQVQVNAQSHPTVPKPQLLMTPTYSKPVKNYQFQSAYQIKETEDLIHIEFQQPLRTITNGMLGEGIQWLKHFCNLYTSDGTYLKEDIQTRIGNSEIPYEQAVVMISSGNLQEMVIVKKEVDNIEFMVMVMPGGKNTSINTMLFVDAHFTDGALISGYMKAIEGKMKALYELQFMESHSNTDTLLLATTQQGEAISNDEKMGNMGEVISEVIYSATKEALTNIQR